MEQQEDGLPVRIVTVNQVVAWNIAYYRRAAHMTQQQLADRLGWTKNKVSEAERSWDGKRTREFDAQMLADIASVLGVPVTGLFFPPEDDGRRQRYMFPPPNGSEGDCLPLSALMKDVILAGEADLTEMLDVYQKRFRFAAGKYLEPEWAKMIGRMLRGDMDQDMRADLAGQLRTRYEQLMDTARECWEIAEGLHPLFDQDAGGGQGRAERAVNDGLARQ